jgi:hypothetical protein
MTPKSIPKLCILLNIKLCRLHAFSSVSSPPHSTNSGNVIDTVNVNKEKEQKDNSKNYGKSKNSANIEICQQTELQPQPVATPKYSSLSPLHSEKETTFQTYPYEMQHFQRNLRQSKLTRKRKELLTQLESKIVNQEKRQHPVDSMEQLTTEIAEFFLSFVQ